ncbi:MAG: peptidase and chymotrypsin/Hap [Marmoricola sp.]|jgi:putative serine protease PepD|nr:peptidase and chymotrypsin/Hap [Marmoricola sp.]
MMKDMDEENYPVSDPNVPRREQSDAGLYSSMQSPTPADETRPLPPFQNPAPSTSATAPARRTGATTAAILAGALVIGGAAGVGGSAWYDAWKGDDSPSSTSQVASADSPVTASSASDKSGTVQQVAANVLPSVVKINVTGSQESGSGSGIILKSDGEILTNNHVVAIAGAKGTISVNFNNGSAVKATVVGTDPVTDLAVIKAEGVSDLKPAVIGDSSALQVGQSVVAVGSPYGLNATVTSGIVSALNRPVSVDSSQDQAPQQSDPFGNSDPFGFGQGQSQPQQPTPSTTSLSTTYPAIQTDAAINPGNSGGPLVNMSGEVVGINSSIRTSDSTDSSSEGGSIGLGFAIPMNEVLPIVNQLINHQTPTHARLGATVSDVTGNTLEQGALIKDLESGAAGSAAGLQKGDVITKVDNQVIDGSESLVATIRGHRPGDSVKITYIRGGKTSTVQAKLGSDAKSKTS